MNLSWWFFILIWDLNFAFFIVRHPARFHAIHNTNYDFLSASLAINKLCFSCEETQMASSFALLICLRSKIAFEKAALLKWLHHIVTWSPILIGLTKVSKKHLQAHKPPLSAGSKGMFIMQILTEAICWCLDWTNRWERPCSIKNNRKNLNSATIYRFEFKPVACQALKEVLKLG